MFIFWKWHYVAAYPECLFRASGFCSCEIIFYFKSLNKNIVELFNENKKHAVLVSLLAYPFTLLLKSLYQSSPCSLILCNLILFLFVQLTLTFFYKRNTIFPYKDKILVFLYIDLYTSQIIQCNIFGLNPM